MLKIMRKNSYGNVILVEKKEDGTLYIMKTFNGDMILKMDLKHPFILTPTAIFEVG